MLGLLIEAECVFMSLGREREQRRENKCGFLLGPARFKPIQGKVYLLFSSDESQAITLDVFFLFYDHNGAKLFFFFVAGLILLSQQKWKNGNAFCVFLILPHFNWPSLYCEVGKSNGEMKQVLGCVLLG